MSTYFRRSRFVFGSTDFTTEVSARPWIPVGFTIGGMKVSAAGVPAAYIVRRDTLYDLTIRANEGDEWQSVLDLIAFGQVGDDFLWYPDADENVSIPVYLEEPTPGTRWNPSRIGEYLRMFEVNIVLRNAPSVTTWRPYFEDEIFTADIIPPFGGPPIIGE